MPNSKCAQASDLLQQVQWCLNLNLTFEKLRIGPGNGLLISILEKLNLFHLTIHITLAPS